MSRRLQVRCLVCGDILCYSRERTGPLIEHLRAKHPHTHVARLPAYPHSPTDSLRLFHSGNVKVKRSMNRSCDNIDSLKRESTLDKDEQRKRYRYTVETWRPGNSKIVCPKCGAETYPQIRRKKDKSSMKALGASCMFGCWPLCFVPFLMCGNKLMELYCGRCESYLGTFDAKTGLLSERALSSTGSTIASSRSAPNLINP